MPRAATRATGTLWLGSAFVFLGMGGLLAWLLLQPGGHATFVAVDNVAQCVGPLLMVPLCWRGLLGRRGGQAAPAVLPATQRWAQLFIGLGLVSEAVGQIIFTYYEQALHQSAPFPAWSDAAWLLAYPLLLLGILLLPARPLAAAARTRVVLDGLLTMTALATMSWYFILGPTVLQGAGTPFAKIVGAAYPLCDLVLIVCLLVISSHAADGALRGAGRLLSLGLGIVVVTDSIFDYQTLHGAYETGSLLDLGWPLGYMLIGLAIPALYAAHARGLADAPAPAQVAATPIWRVLLPYALIPVIGTLVTYAWFTSGHKDLLLGLLVGSALIVAVVLLRQVAAMVENRRLYLALHDTYRQLETRNSDLATANTHLQNLATTDPITGLANHRAMFAALDQELERCHRYGRPCSVLFRDLDHFKALNDACGHAAGDTALREFGGVVRDSLRGVDILARWGGEEFVVLLPETTDAQAMDLAERVRGAVAGHVFAASGGTRLTCSLGVASYPQDAQRRDDLVEMADQAMYAAKRLGRNQIRAIGDPAVAALVAEGGMAGSRDEAALLGTVEALAALVATRDSYTGRHTSDVAALAMRLAVALGMDAAGARLLEIAARLHDVGKVAVPDAVLSKPGRLTDAEWVLMRRHAAVGAEVLCHVPALRPLAALVHAHHEHYDGRGYPDGLAGQAIPLGARILAVADAYDAMTTDRPYRPARDSQWGLAQLIHCAGSQFDPTVVEALVTVLASSQPALAGCLSPDPCAGRLVHPSPFVLS